jgi:hypothetical protein
MKWKIVLSILGGAIGLYVILVLVRVPHAADKQEEAEAIAKIHATRLTLDDVMGKNLPPDPGAEADKTIQGIDANKNGIRDDVELAIFKQYPASAKTRAALLQYALELQLETTQPIVSREVVAAVNDETTRGMYCIDHLVPLGVNGETTNNDDFEKAVAYEKFVSQLHQNTSARKDYINNSFYRFTDVYEFKKGCDIDLATLPN